ncbi:ABC transporter permease subunit [Desulfatibacillum aliphaticivorans]|uniref:ABC transporter permease subunit n=1 Tax=Desulfatibacillum aliphaticivorans TaxID=218208 RepID=UPI00041A987A|nr:branched-chain amino acid ABC transporter permease [Desulfatibacillum aliphaticivorans]
MGEILKSLKAAVWFMFLTFPIMVIKVNPIEDTVVWRWMNMLYIGVGIFFLSFLWRFMLARRDRGKKAEESGKARMPIGQRIAEEPKIKYPAIVLVGIFALSIPFWADMYNTNIMTNVLIYVMLGLGLNIVVGLAGLLDLGYVAFYAVGAYAYALLNHHFGANFWVILPMAGFLGAAFGVTLGFPVLRLRGDYLAIVTLGFGEIIRLVLENWNEFSMGPSGIANIDRPPFFGIKMDLFQKTDFMYYVVLALAILTIIAVTRLKNSRIGRAWIALREDEIACQAMGVDRTKTKLMAFALGATWASMAGVVFAAKSTFINPPSFSFWESVLILVIVVLGGMGSVVGVILGASIIILLPEYFRQFSEYRMILFGGAMVLMMVFRPTGIITAMRQKYTIHK